MQPLTVKWIFRVLGSLVAFFIGGYTFQTFIHFVRKLQSNNFRDLFVYKCEKCGHALSFWDTIPFFSSVYHKFTCHYCGCAYNRRYAICEVLGGLDYALFYATCANCLDACMTPSMISLFILGSTYVAIQVIQIH